MTQKGQEVYVHTNKKQIDPSTFAAMVASGDDEQCGLYGIANLSLAKEVVSRIARNSNTEKLLRCVAASKFPRELLLHLMQEYALTNGALVTFVRTFEKGLCELDFEFDASQVVYNKYWSVRVHERLQKLDFKRAWELVKKSQVEANDQREIVAPADVFTSAMLAQALYNALCKGERISPVDEAREADVFVHIPASAQGVSPKLASQFPGIAFACKVGGVENGRINVRGRKIIAIASYLNKVRRDKRRKKAVVHAFG